MAEKSPEELLTEASEALFALPDESWESLGKGMCMTRHRYEYGVPMSWDTPLMTSNTGSFKFYPELLVVSKRLRSVHMKVWMFGTSSADLWDMEYNADGTHSVTSPKLGKLEGAGPLVLEAMRGYEQLLSVDTSLAAAIEPEA